MDYDNKDNGCGLVTTIDAEKAELDHHQIHTDAVNVVQLELDAWYAAKEEQYRVSVELRNEN